MGIDSACILCNFPDTSVHLCRSYSDVQGVWSASGFPWVNLIKGGSFKYWWIEIMERCSLTELSHITCLCYIFERAEIGCSLIVKHFHNIEYMQEHLIWLLASVILGLLL